MYPETNGGTGLTARIASGSTADVSNGQCTLSGTGSSYSFSGNDLSLTAAVTFSGTLTGQKNIYLLAQDTGNINSGWVLKGNWTP